MFGGRSWSVYKRFTLIRLARRREADTHGDDLEYLGSFIAILNTNYSLSLFHLGMVEAGRVDCMVPQWYRLRVRFQSHSDQSGAPSSISSSLSSAVGPADDVDAVAATAAADEAADGLVCARLEADA